MENKNTDTQKVKNENNEISDKELMIDHDYDGIKELDNPPPPWLMWLFYITVIWGVGYVAYFHWFSVGDLQEAEYERIMSEAADKYKDVATDTETINILTTEADLTKGAEIYTKSCSACHGAEGKGGIGPDFTDNKWIYGNNIKDVFGVIKNGTDKGMPPFKSLEDDGILQVASYVLTKFGTVSLNEEVNSEIDSTEITEEKTTDES
ncbi:MAG: c-type cytochrome [Bacteroidales bacterium]|nr:c-type cytochrome [Bacteroidales bacterium]